MQLDRQWKAFEFHVRSMTHVEIAKLLGCRPETVRNDIAFEYERRKAMYAQGRDEFTKRAFHSLEAVKKMNFESLSANDGRSENGQEYRTIIGAIALQARLMGFDARRGTEARDGEAGQRILEMPEVPQQLPDDAIVQLLHAIAESSGYGDDPRITAEGKGAGPIALGPPAAAPIAPPRR